MLFLTQQRCLKRGGGRELLAEGQPEDAVRESCCQLGRVAPQ